MEEKVSLETNEETRARGVKRTSDIKIAKVSTSKKKRAKKAPAEAPEPAQAHNNFNDEEKQSEEDAKRSRMLEDVRDVAEGSISIEDLTAALNKAVTKKSLRHGTQGVFISLLKSQASSTSTWQNSTDRQELSPPTKNALPL
jgi:hypothetical protein